MTSSRKLDSDKAAKYAIAASKGFSYYLRKSAQRHLQELLKQLPSAAHSIYNEYYRDLMCAKACAPESAAAMAKFVTSSFPKIAKKHNTFARDMNEKIDINEHEGYEPVEFPVVAEPDVDDEEAAAVVDTGKKRKRALAGSASLPNQGAMPQKKAKTKSGTISAATSGSPTTPPPSSPHQTSRSSAQANSDGAAAEGSNADPPPKGDLQSLTPESTEFADDDRNSRHSSPLSDVPSSAQLSDENESLEESAMQPNADEQDVLQGQHAVTADLIEGHDQEDILSPLPSQALLQSMDGDFPTGLGEFDVEPETNIDNETPRESSAVPMTSLVKSPLDIAEPTTMEASTLENNTEELFEDGTLNDSLTGSGYNFMSEEEGCEDGMLALKDFDWDRKGVQWLDSRDLVSIHYEEIGGSAGVSEGNYWDDAEAECLFPGIDEDVHIPMEAPMDLADDETE